MYNCTFKIGYVGAVATKQHKTFHSRTNNCNASASKSLIDNFQNSSSKFKFIIYADETILLFKDTNADNMIQDITNEQHKIMSWIKSNNLHLNRTKSTFITFHAN